MTMAPYTLYVLSLSPYSDKIRLYLRLKRLPFVEVRENFRNREQVLKARTGKTMVPVLITPDDRALNDSTAITRALEGEAPAPALRPADPGHRAFDALLEDWADEWLLRAMFGSRWLHPADAEQNRIILAADMSCGAPEIDLAVGKEILAQGLIASLPLMGATPDTLAFLLDDLAGTCEDLDALLRARRFLGGDEPTVADLAVYGQLNQLRRDPTGRGIVGDPARPHGRWLRDVEHRADGEPAAHPGGAPADGRALGPLARRIAGTYVRFAVANALALREAPKGPLDVELADGVPFRAVRSAYGWKCLQAVLAEMDAGLAAAGRLVGGEADEAVLAAIAPLGTLLDPYPALRARAAA
jgi:glutathione S-transferase